MELIKKYFPNLTKSQLDAFEQLGPLYEDWNQKINVISRKDMEHFYERHVLHSLALAKVAKFANGSRVLDVGTGGGFPGIPLSILYPKVQFLLVDSIGKKLQVVRDVADMLDLKNVEAQHVRAEQVAGKFDYVVSRAVTRMPKFMDWVKGKVYKGEPQDAAAHGIWCLKGGDLTEELSTIKKAKQFEIRPFFEEEFFETKKVVHVPMP